VAVAAGVSKTFRVTERVRLRMDGTFDNLPNYPDLQAPAVDVSTSSNFGKLTESKARKIPGTGPPMSYGWSLEI